MVGLSEFPRLETVTGMLLVMPLHTVKEEVVIWKFGAGGIGLGPLVAAKATDGTTMISSIKSFSELVHSFILLHQSY
jgi:hypothetical protein